MTIKHSKHLNDGLSIEVYYNWFSIAPAITCRSTMLNVNDGVGSLRKHVNLYTLLSQKL